MKTNKVFEKLKNAPLLRGPSKNWSIGGLLLLVLAIASLFSSKKPNETIYNQWTVIGGLGFLLCITVIYAYRSSSEDRPELSTTPQSVEDRKAILDKRVLRAVSNGWHLEAQTDYEAVVSGGRKVNHILHLLLSLLTFGTWIIPWIFMSLGNRPTRETISVDTFGNTRFIKNL